MIKPRQQLLAQLLTYSGTLPLVAAALLSITGQGQPMITTAAIAYGAIIIAFLSGIHWAVYMFFHEKCPRNLFIISNITALLSWLSLLLSEASVMLGTQLLCFGYLLIQDIHLRRADVLSEWFFTLRRNATIIVISAQTVLLLST